MAGTRNRMKSLCRVCQGRLLIVAMSRGTNAIVAIKGNKVYMVILKEIIAPNLPAVK